MKAVNRLHINDADFDTRLEQLLAWESVSDDNVAKAVADILERVRLHGDSALLELTNQYDDRQVESAEQLEISQAQLKNAFDRVPAASAEALQAAAERITSFHERQISESWQYEDCLLYTSPSPRDY